MRDQISRISNEKNQLNNKYNTLFEAYIETKNLMGDISFVENDVHMDIDQENEIPKCNKRKYFVTKNFENCIAKNNYQNLSDCPYCPRKGFKNVGVNIGHMHKCKICRNLNHQCNCNS